MKKTVGLFIAAALAAGTAFAKDIVTFKSNGAFANLEHFDGANNRFFTLSASQDGSQDAANGTVLTTFLNFLTEECDYTAGVCSGFQGYGQIPNNDFKAHEGGAKLYTNTAGNPDFKLESFQRDLNTGETTTAPVTGGVFTVDWRKNSDYALDAEGKTKERFFGTTRKSSGKSSRISADASGSWLGLPFPQGAAGAVGTTVGKITTITRD